MTNYDKLTDLVKDAGMDRKWSNMFVKKLRDDEMAFEVDDETKRWALSKGFFPGRVALYNLNEENYRDYLPDFNYFMMHPINHHFKIWVNDKLTLKYVLNSNGCADTMPRYFLYVENNGNYTYLMDSVDTVKKDKNYIFNLLKHEGTLAIKPNSGTSGGRGFMKMVYKNGEIFVNNKKIDREEFEEVISNLENNIVTEYAYQHDSLAKIWGESECTLRVIMAKMPYKTPYEPEGWKCLISFARFGAAISGGASNLSSGGIGVGFDFETGQFNDTGIRYKRFCPDGKWVCSCHPDSGVVWKDTKLPNWDTVKEKIFQVCDHIGSLDYLGLDIIIKQDGFNFCEINTHPAADYAQVMCGPILKDERIREFFECKGLLKINSESFYEMYLQSQE